MTVFRTTTRDLHRITPQENITPQRPFITSACPHNPPSHACRHSHELSFTSPMPPAHHCHLPVPAVHLLNTLHPQLMPVLCYLCLMPVITFAVFQYSDFFQIEEYSSIFCCLIFLLRDFPHSHHLQIFHGFQDACPMPNECRNF